MQTTFPDSPKPILSYFLTSVRDDNLSNYWAILFSLRWFWLWKISTFLTLENFDFFWLWKISVFFPLWKNFFFFDFGKFLFFLTLENFDFRDDNLSNYLSDYMYTFFTSLSPFVFKSQTISMRKKLSWIVKTKFELFFYFGEAWKFERLFERL